MTPNVSVSVFKRFLSRAYKICSERYIDEEIQSTNPQRMAIKEKRKDNKKFKQTAKPTR